MPFFFYLMWCNVVVGEGDVGFQVIRTGMIVTAGLVRNPLLDNLNRDLLVIGQVPFNIVQGLNPRLVIPLHYLCYKHDLKACHVFAFNVNIDHHLPDPVIVPIDTITDLSDHRPIGVIRHHRFSAHRRSRSGRCSRNGYSDR